jgi:hypothetical protein
MECRSLYQSLRFDGVIVRRIVFFEPLSCVSMDEEKGKT